MTHILSVQSGTVSPAVDLGVRARNVGRFVLHFVEMALAMELGMLIFMPLASFIPAALQQIGMALFMAWPMVAWMRIRGHAWRHGLEMAAAMLVPWAAVLVLVALGAATALPWLKQADGPAMYLGMLGIMLVRRDHYAHGGAHQHSVAHAASRPAHRIGWRRLLLAGAYLAAILLVPAVVGVANVGSKLLAPLEPLQAPAYSGALPAPPTPDPNTKIAVVVSGPMGAEIGDALEAYEILARSGAFNVYSVAPARTILPLQPGSGRGAASSLDFVPHFSFAEYDAQIGRAPDVIAIPWFDTNYTPERDAVVLDWIRGHFGSNTTILGICSGNMILADTGLVAGRTATSNTGTFDYVESHSPTTTWLHNVRYVDDGNIVTSSNLTAGIDATLHVVDRFAGRATALDVARQIGYTQTGALDDPRFQPPAFADYLVPIVINAGFEGPLQHLGVLVYDGVTELGLSGLVDPYVSSASARPFVLASERRIVRSRDGFQFLPRYDFSTVPTLDRVLVPAGENMTAKQQAIAAWSAVQPERRAEDIYQNVGSGETAYDASLRDLARTHNAGVARAVGAGLFYTAAPQDFSDAAWPVSGALAVLALSLLGAAAVFAATHLKRPRQARPQPGPLPA
jgi:transcriptional regulator GlxA family with amidase domain